MKRFECHFTSEKYQGVRVEFANSKDEAIALAQQSLKEYYPYLAGQTVSIKKVVDLGDDNPLPEDEPIDLVPFSK